jgi:hypothetical protein
VGSAQSEPIDVVYTWVDDTFPGYRTLLQRYATVARDDLNPNRTRDNLQLLRYSLRSLEQHVAWVRRVYIVTCRPQVPAWLDVTAADLRVVHHDEFFAQPKYLPTFNSFAIGANLHRLPGLGERYLHLDDDMLFGRPVTLADFVDPDGRYLLWPKFERSPGGHLWDRAGRSPWQLGLAMSNALLDERYGRRRRWLLKHVPALIERELWRSMVEQLWPAAFGRTITSRFRARGTVVPEHLYPYVMLYEGRARLAPIGRSYLRAHYQGVDNLLPQQLVQFAFLRWLRPPFLCLNDNFGARPSRSVVQLARRYLEWAYPRPSHFERTP